MFNQIIVQLIGIFAMGLYIASYQFKKPSLFYLFSFSGALCFTIHYLLLNSWAGCICNLISMLKALYLCLEKGEKKKWIACLFMASFIGFTAAVIKMKIDSMLAILTCIASLTHTIIYFQDNPYIIRYFQIGVISPLWIIYNIFNFSIGGILSESFIVCSAIIFLLRHKKDIKKHNKYAHIKRDSVG